MSRSRHRTCGFLMTVDSTCHLPPPRSGDSAAADPQLLIRQACRPLTSQLASISEKSFHHPPPGDATGSLQLGPNTNTDTGSDVIRSNKKYISTTGEYKVAFSLRPSTAIARPQSNVCECRGRSKNLTLKACYLRPSTAITHGRNAQ